MVVTALAAALLAFAPVQEAQAAPVLLSQGKPVTASSQEHAGTPASAAVDGDTGTRWSSAFSDPQWIRVDLGTTATISQVELRWEAAYAKAYRIETSQNGTDWTTAYSTTSGTGGTETLNVVGTARHVRMLGTARATGYGYSLWEFKVYGSTGGDGGPTLPGGGTSARTCTSSTRPRPASRPSWTRCSDSRSRRSSAVAGTPSSSSRARTTA
ncbi:discoidin domain-containing protein [Streptomyces thermolilacinus]|uniref:discoidin domain-containing protein n=1 Tax=Streptomyces thermolilacinus TaxID=285540 RepID=UPI0033CE4246